MTARILTRHFARIGARLRFRKPEPLDPVGSGLIRLDIAVDEGGEFFQIELPRQRPPELVVLDVAQRHLLLLVRSADAKHKLLVGQDEKEGHWFVAAVPPSAPVGTVGQAVEALKPPEVRDREAGRRRRERAYRRQGEWFLMPAAIEEPDPLRVLHHEPLVRARSRKPHIAEFCYREGHATLYVCDLYPDGVIDAEYVRIRKRERETKPAVRSSGWRVVKRDGQVFVRGWLRHPDHRALFLDGWHRALLNGEERHHLALRHVRFLD